MNRRLFPTVPSRKVFPAVLLSIILAIIGSNAPAQTSPPTTVLYEAENPPANGDVIIKEEDGALGGKYVTHPREWNPLFIGPSPTEAGDYQIWARARGFAMILKAAEANGTQHELKQIFDTPNDWAWMNLGKYTKDDLKHNIIIIRAPGGSDDAGLDAVIVSNDPGFNPSEVKDFNKYRVQANHTGATAENAVMKPVVTAPEESPTAAGQITITVDWTQAIRTATAGNYSVAIFKGSDPTVANQPDYVKGVAYLESGGVFRYHNAALVGDSKTTGPGWVDKSAHKWDAAKIKSALDALSSVPGKRILTINTWPEWMDTDHDGMLDKDKYGDFATFCAELVQIVNIDQKRDFGFEITNEQDNLYWMKPLQDKTPDHLNDLVTIYNQAAVAMRKIDPKVYLGGPAATRADMVDQLKRFVQGTTGNLDFLSVHMYASGDAHDSDRGIYDKAEMMGNLVANLVAMLREASPDRKIDLHCNEFNISWTWETHDQRMVNAKGAVFDALALSSMATSGLDAACAWNEMDNTFGKMDDSFKLRPSAHLYHALNQTMVGDIVRVKSSRPTRVMAYAVKGDKSRTIMFINQTNDVQSVILSTGEWLPHGDVKRTDLGENGLQDTSIPATGLSSGIPLPAQSVVWLVFPQ